jgi:hypothetical protein
MLPCDSRAAENQGARQGARVRAEQGMQPGGADCQESAVRKAACPISAPCPDNSAKALLCGRSASPDGLYNLSERLVCFKGRCFYFLLCCYECWAVQELLLQVGDTVLAAALATAVLCYTNISRAYAQQSHLLQITDTVLATALAALYS